MNENTQSNIHVIEEKVLAAMMSDKRILDEVFARLDIQDIDNAQNRTIFTVMHKLYDDNKPIDLFTVSNFMKNNHEFDFKNHDGYLQKILNKFTTSHDINTHIDILKNSAITRHLAKFGNKLTSLNMDITDFDDQLWNVEKDFLELIHSKTSTQIKSSKQVSEEYLTKLQYIQEHRGKMTGTPCGYQSIDNITNGFQPGDLIILAARPSIGKTALSLNFLLNASKTLEKDEVVVIFSLEMGCEQLFQRMVSCKSGVNSDALRKGDWTSEEDYAIHEAISQLGDLNIMIDDSSDLSILDVQTKLKQLSATKKIKLVVVDYLQLLRGSKNNASHANRQQEVAQISRTLKAIARDIETPVIAVAQLSRKIEERKGDDKKPMLSDLRESGAIEQDADLVTFINYERGEIDKDNPEATTKYKDTVAVDFIIAKHRNGATGEISLLFEKSIGKYNDMSHK